MPFAEGAARVARRGILEDTAPRVKRYEGKINEILIKKVLLRVGFFLTKS